MSYVEVRGQLTPGLPAWIRWENGAWSGDELALRIIEDAILLDCAGGQVWQSPTGPAFPVDSPLGARLLACEPFWGRGRRLDSIDTDIVLPDLECVPGRVY